MRNHRIEDSVYALKCKCKEARYKTESTKFTRERKLPQTDIVWYLAMQKGRTTSLELDSYFKEKTGGYETDITKQAFSKQRQYLKPEIFIDLAKDYLKSFYQKTPEEARRYKGHLILAVDGSMFEIPNTPKLREEYKAQINSSKDRISARARVSMLYDVENGFIVDALISDCGKGEGALCYENIENAKDVVDLRNSIIIFDRGYPSVELMLYLEENGIKYICRLQSEMYEREKQGMRSDDEWIEIELDCKRRRKIKNEGLLETAMEKKRQRCRLSKVVLSTGEAEFLLSNIDKEVISEEEMIDAYFKRWRIETGYDILKNKMHLENFTGRTKIAIEQDFHAQIYTHNLLQDIKNEANEEARSENKGKNLKYEYKPNINILAGVLKNILIAVMFTESDEEKERLYRTIVDKAKKNLVAIRPNRSFERKEYSGMNKYRTNLRPNM
jgi:hypothetical protein